ncbi:MAG: iron-sulfur cluster assembly scaffold protein [Metamycoplasmataceae bacterium]
MDSYNNDQKREMVMDYYLNPRRRKPDDFPLENLKTYYHHSNNCVDEITLIQLKENDYVFQGSGCAVFLASSEIFLEETAKNNFKNIKELSLAFEKLINHKDMSDLEKQIVGKLNIFSNVKKHLNRVECALMITKVFEKI